MLITPYFSFVTVTNMAAPISAVLGSCFKTYFKSARTLCQIQHLCSRKNQRHASSWSNLFRGSKDEPAEEIGPRSLTGHDGPTTTYDITGLKKREGLISVRAYSPPSDVEAKVTAIAQSIVGSALNSDYILDDRLVKFKLLTRLMKELDHIIPNSTLTELSTLAEVTTYFSTPVRDQSVFENLAKLNLPKNLHIQMEPMRFDPDTDTFFDGKTAFPDRPTIISSLRYRRKYKGNSGKSRNQRSLTNYEKEKELEEERQIARIQRFPSEGIEREPHYKRMKEREVPII